MKKVGFVYETTNRINGKKYIGSHLGHEDDVYFGSGIDLLEDIKKYGIVNFDRKILEFATDQEMLAQLEHKYLREVDAKNNAQYYNRSNLASGISRRLKEYNGRPNCNVCGCRPAAINCHKHGRTYYRLKCDHCSRLAKKKKLPKPRWQMAGYKKKTKCDRCGFIAQHHSQLGVYHVDGNLNNTDLKNLKTICHNCMAIVTRLDLPWRPGDLEPDH